jgi:hypothetical protein
MNYLLGSFFLLSSKRVSLLAFGSVFLGNAAFSNFAPTAGGGVTVSITEPNGEALVLSQSVFGAALSQSTLAPMPEPLVPVASAGRLASGIHLKWEAAESETEYAVYRSLDSSLLDEEMIATTSAQHFVDQSADVGVRYYYRIQSMQSMDGYYGEYTELFTGYQRAGNSDGLVLHLSFDRQPYLDCSGYAPFIDSQVYEKALVESPWNQAMTLAGGAIAIKAYDEIDLMQDDICMSFFYKSHEQESVEKAVLRSDSLEVVGYDGGLVFRTGVGELNIPIALYSWHLIQVVSKNDKFVVFVNNEERASGVLSKGSVFDFGDDLVLGSAGFHDAAIDEFKIFAGSYSDSEESVPGPRLGSIYLSGNSIIENTVGTVGYVFSQEHSLNGLRLVDDPTHSFRLINGRLSVVKPLDFESTPFVLLNVEASYEDGLVNYSTLVIEVRDWNETRVPDLLPFEEVLIFGTSPYKADTDGDGVSEVEELLFYQSDPLDPGSSIPDFEIIKEDGIIRLRANLNLHYTKYGLYVTHTLEDFRSWQMIDYSERTGEHVYISPVLNSYYAGDKETFFRLEFFTHSFLAETPSTFQYDRDSDGLSDFAENYLGFNADLTDTDSDGIDDLMEVLLGLNPTDPSDAFYSYSNSALSNSTVVSLPRGSLQRASDKSAFLLVFDDQKQFLITPNYKRPKE